MSAMIGRRAYRLDRWLVGALIPCRYVGSYTLVRGREPHYAGRSDRDLAGRLRQHARSGRREYFAFDVHATAERAFVAECASFHSTPDLDNRVHPAAPRGSAIRCPFCSDSSPRPSRSTRPNEGGEHDPDDA